MECRVVIFLFHETTEHLKFVLKFKQIQFPVGRGLSACCIPNLESETSCWLLTPQDIQLVKTYMRNLHLFKVMEYMVQVCIRFNSGKTSAFVTVTTK